MSMTGAMPQSQKFRFAKRSSRFSELACSIFAFLAMTFLATGLQAAVIFDNFDSGGGFHPTNNVVAAFVNTLPLTGPLPLRAAGQFTVTGGDYNLSSITLPISFANINHTTQTLRVRLTGDNANAPGTTLEVLSENQGIWPPIATPFTTTTTLTSAHHPLLAKGSKYWIVIELTSVVVNIEYTEDYRWFRNTSGTTVPFHQQQGTAFNVLPTDPWTGFSGNINVAFRVETVVPQAAVIFDNFDSGGGFHPTDNVVAAFVDTMSPFQALPSRAAGQFTVTGGDSNLGSITLPISFANINHTTQTLRVRLTGDNANAPGTTLEVLSENQGIWPPIANPFIATTTLTSALHPLLAKGSKYWIVIELTSVVNTEYMDDYRWFRNTSGTTVPFRQQQGTAFNVLPTDPWTGFSGNINVAFRVEGTAHAGRALPLLLLLLD